MRRHRAHHSPYPRSNNAPLSETAGLIRTFNSETNPARPVRPSPLARSLIPDMPLDMLDKIRSFPLFQSAPEEFLAAIGSYLRPQTHSPHDYILTEGDEGKAMYWLYRGAVAVTSRDGESTYFELKPGAFFGEIGILMSIPRTATIIARTKCLLVQLKKEDLFSVLPSFPEVERAIREEAQERLAILNNKKQEIRTLSRSNSTASRGEKRAYEDDEDDDLTIPDGPRTRHYSFSYNKKRKSPSPGLVEAAASSALGTGSVHIRQLLKELPLFSKLPSEILHFLGSSAQQRTYPPFTDIIKQDSQGREVFFIIRGEVEVLDEKGSRRGAGKLNNTPKRKARLRQGNYFGEVASLSLAPRRTATVRSVSLVECLLITGEVIAEFWERCPPEIKDQVEKTAKQRLHSTEVNDVVMKDVVDSTPAINELAIVDNPRIPKVVFDQTIFDSDRLPEREVKEPVDPDPYLIPDLDNVRARSRRSSLAPISPEIPQEIKSKPSTPPDPIEPKRPTIIPRTSKFERGILPNDILVSVFNHFDLHDLMKLRLVSSKWSRLLRESPSLLHFLDLSMYNNRINDSTIKNIGPFVGNRPKSIDISNCFHLTDDGFISLVSMCGEHVTSWSMKSVWEVSAPAIHEMVKQAKKLEDIDLSNCRKVNDALLLHVIGNVPLPIPPQGPFRPFRPLQVQGSNIILGSQKLKKLTLSYCKHVTDRSMAHIGNFARTRLEEIDLTRCTTITDHGFEAWGQHRFSRLTKLCLADCTYLTDNAIVSLAHAAPGLKYLDLVCVFFFKKKKKPTIDFPLKNFFF
jgi:F-box and leucine-rich repeat protein 7